MALAIDKVRQIARETGVSFANALRVAKEKGIIVADATGKLANSFRSIARQQNEEQTRKINEAIKGGILDRLSDVERGDIEKLNKRRAKSKGTLKFKKKRSGLEVVVIKELEQERAIRDEIDGTEFQNDNSAIGLGSDASQAERQRVINNLRGSFAERLLKQGKITQAEFDIGQGKFRPSDDRNNQGKTPADQAKERNDRLSIAGRLQSKVANQSKLRAKLRTLGISLNGNITALALAGLIQKGVIKESDL